MFVGISYVHWLVVFSACISIAGAVPYIRNTLKGTTRPNRVSWFMWSFAPLVGVGAPLSAGADPWVTVRIFLAGFLPMLVFLASFVNPKAFWKLDGFDMTCGALSFIALGIWLVLDLPIYAILLAAVGDGFAVLPTLRKAWKYPETETGITYLASLAAALLVLPSISDWNIENSAFQIYLVLANTALIFAVYRRRIVLFG